MYSSICFALHLISTVSAGQTDSPVCPASPSHAGSSVCKLYDQYRQPNYISKNIFQYLFFLPGPVMPGKDKDQKEKENKGLFSKFRKSKKNSEQVFNFFALIMRYCIKKKLLTFRGRFVYFGLPLVDVHPVVWEQSSYHVLIGCLLFKGNDGQCPGFSSAREQAPSTQHGPT